MNQEKIGAFIKMLREENEMTQEQLAMLIPISRQAVSKWERGITIPDSTVLLKLSEIFNVSINEILSGKLLSKSNEKEINEISLKLYDDNKKRKKFIKFLIAFIVIILLIFLGYYFVTSYKSIKVYNISGKSENVTFNDGMLVSTREKIYFRISDFVSKDNFNLLKLYYIDKNQKNIEILSTTNDTIMFVDYNGYNEYLKISDLKYILNNLYLDVITDDNIETIKLSFKQDYINDSFLFFKKDKSANIKSSKIKKIYTYEEEELILKIKDKFKKVDDTYTYILNQNNFKLEFFYQDETNTLTLSKNDNNINETWIYQIEKNIIQYYDSINKKSFSYISDNNYYMCNSESCDNHDEKLEEFFNYLDISLK